MEVLMEDVMADVLAGPVAARRLEADGGRSALPGTLSACPIGARYLPTPQHVVDAMLAMAELTLRDTVYDPGCGDGRFVITAATRYGAHGVGIDIDAWCIEDSRENARRAGVEPLVTFVHADAKDVDLSPATVVTLYMPTRWNEQFLPKLRRELAPGSRIVTYMYDFGGWPPAEVQFVTDQYRRESPIYLWRLGLSDRRS
jgi:SAM-dependent methyltransferase